MGFDGSQIYEKGGQAATGLLTKYKKNLAEFGKEDWETQWQKVMIDKVI